MESKVGKLAESYGTVSYAYKYREGLIGAVSAGFFLVLLGALFIITPGLFGRAIDFFEDFGAVTVPNTTIGLFAPLHPLSHRAVYTAAEQFCFAFGVFQIVILALRFASRSPISKKADTIGSLIFWLGAGYLVRMILLESTRWTSMTTWFVFWAVIITLIGITLIVRAVILVVTIPRRTI